MLYVNLWNTNSGYTIFQTAALADIAITPETQTILAIDCWEVRALFLNPLLPVMAQRVILSHPKGHELAWRAYVFVDAHLPLSEILRLEVAKKRPILTTRLHRITEEAKTPRAWIKEN